jgi:hypothetical protein
MSGEGELLCDGKPQRLHDDLRLLGRAQKENWPVDPEYMAAITRRVESIALQNADDEICLKAVARLQAMIEQNRKAEPQPVKKVEHHHVHDLGSVTAENLEQHRSARAARLTGALRNSQ